jgi:hypothetical protein
MSVIITQVSNTQTFGTWLARTNQIAAVLSANAVTTDNTVVGGFTSGNGTVIGHFGSNTLFAMDEFRGGNVAVSNTLSVTSNTIFKYNTDELVSITSNTSNSNVSINVVTVDVSVSDMNVDAEYLNVNTFYEVNINTVSFTANATSSTLNFVNTSINGSNLIINTTNTTINSNTVINNRLNVSNAVVFANTLSVTNATTLSNTLNVVGAANLQSTANVGGTLGVTGATTLASTLSVTGAANVLSTFGMGGAANALSTFGVSGAANALSTFGVSGAANAMSTFGVTGATTLLSTLNVVGAANLQSSANVAGTLGVNGAVTIANTLNVSNAAVFSNTISVVGAANLQSTVGIGGNANVAGTLRVAGDLNVTGTLTYNGSAVASVIPNANVTYDLGNTTFYWNNSYIGRGTFSNGINVTAGSNSVFNANLLFIDTSNSRVGIGNSTPAQKLVVAGTIESTTGGIKFPDANTQTKAFQAVGSDTQIQFNTANVLTGSAALTFNTSGNNLTVANTLIVGGTTINSIAYTTSVSFSFSGTAEVAVDSFPVATYRSAEYLVQFSDSTNTRYQVSKILVVHDDTTSSFTEYGAISTGPIMGTFRTSISTGNVTFLCTPLTATTSVKIFRTNLTV